MLNAPQSVDHFWNRSSPCPHDAVIDVRSPSEFAEDHIPGAVNLPVLDDTERAAVGTLYHQVGSFEARRTGAALVSANIARHLRTYFADQGKDFRPFVHCWRGGDRSASLATVLARIGWRVTVLRGGYKTYRAHVIRELAALPDRFELRVLAGATGTGKTALLHRLQALGGQVLDLERLANHRGSILGGVSTQPSQKYFESLLLDALERLDPAAPVWVEAESNRIGDRFIPPSLWAKMGASSGVELRMPLAMRVSHLLDEYQPLLSDPDTLKRTLQRLDSRHGARIVAEWARRIDAADWRGLVAALLEVHYDPGYERSRRRCFPRIEQTVDLADTSAVSLDTLAERLVKPSCPSHLALAMPLAAPPQPLAVEIVAHRGASFDAPENTVAAIKLAWEQKADAAEFDVYLSKDGQVVVLHDKDLKRTGGVDKLVAELTAEELSKIDVGSWKGKRFAGETVPTLEAMLATVPDGKRVFIEVKCGPEIVPELDRVLEASKLKVTQTAVISFSAPVVAAVKKARPDLQAYWIVSLKAEKGKQPATAAALIARAKEIGADGLDLSATVPVLTADYAKAVKDAGLKLYVWTVNDAEVARTMIAVGVEGITTDRPGRLRDQLAAPPVQ